MRIKVDSEIITGRKVVYYHDTDATHQPFIAHLDNKEEIFTRGDSLEIVRTRTREILRAVARKFNKIGRSLGWKPMPRY